ncbi:MAG TPA: PAS domain-containing protein [Vicinamibacteria bacterium]|nr:PAS domain-containing protein [Vicinamibacteria bacterium]
MSEPEHARARAEVEPALERYQDELDRAAAEGLRRYEEVFEGPPPGLGAHEIDPDKVYRRVNRGALALLGYEREDLVGKPVVQFIVMAETSERSIDKKLSGLVKLKPFVRTFVRKDGRSITLLLLDRHLKDLHGKIVGIRTVFAPVEL